MADDVTLLPCPMCGGTDIRIARLSASPDQSVWCHSCQLRTKWSYRDDAIAAWNTRVPDQRVAELEAELAKSRAWRATLADTGDELLVELRDAQRRIAELEAELAEARDWSSALADALAEYEAEHYPIDPPTPEAAAEFRREQEARNDA